MNNDRDPRAANCRGFKIVGNGKVIGVELDVVIRPDQPYELVHVGLIDEYSPQAAQAIATSKVYGVDGQPEHIPVSLAWPWGDRGTAGLTNFAEPSNDKNEHPITNAFDPSSQEKGPLALCIRDSQNNIISDVVGGLGLPLGHHVSYVVTWSRREVGSNTDMETIIRLLDHILESIREGFRLNP